MRSRRSRLLRGVLFFALLLGGAGAVLRINGLVMLPGQWWYPFIPALFTDHYTAGPLAMTSNTREDNPIWAQMPAFNRALARLSYVATRGVPRAQVAWLLAQSAWPDVPVLPSWHVQPNHLESAISKSLVAAGLEYDRISRRDLLQASVAGNILVVGQARYDSLLISDLDKATPELLAHLVTLAKQGVPIVWLGEFPGRAAGWADHQRRDLAVRTASEVLQELVTRCASPMELNSRFRTERVGAALAPVDGSAMRLRLHRRLLGSETFLLLFNESPQTVRQRYAAPGNFQGAELLNPETGESVGVTIEAVPGVSELEFTVPARRTLVLHLRAVADARGGDGGAMRSDVANSEWSIDSWRNPPRALHPFVRWWWPGNAVDQDELRRELNSLYQAGFGGVELQTLTLGFPIEELKKNRDEIYQVGRPSYFDNLLVVFREAERLGITVDLTLGSGWPSGGPFIDSAPEQQLIMATFDTTGSARIDALLPLPHEPAYAATTNRIIRNTIGKFDDQAKLQRLVAAKLNTSTEPPTLSELIDITGFASAGRVRWDVPPGNYRIFALYQNATSHNVAGSAYPGALERSPVVDHLNRDGIDEYIEKLGEPWLEALAPFKPAALFVDSFELIGELPWSDGFLTAFERQNEYDLAPWLPLLFRQSGESKYLESLAPQGPAYRSADDRGQRIREDYLATREWLFRENFLRPLQAWTVAKGVKLRLQAHGGYGDYLDSYQIADIAEAEGLFGGGSFDFLKLASSAAHVAGHPTVASESFIKLAFDFDRLAIDDYHLLAGNALAAGVNRIIFHGYAYHYPLRP